MSSPYAEDGVVYTVTMIAHGAICGTPITGRFINLPEPESRTFWPMETVEHDHYIDINPAHILHLTPASGNAYTEFVAELGDE